ncbi:hypothetical protein N9M52_00215 [bacterium]|nr:hypothetical protein [bacterium]MDA8752409.1 hypothetical protein [bacterium]
MAFSISDFNSKIGQHGLAKNNLFFARISLPKSITNELLSIAPIVRDLEFYCRGVTLPELSVRTGDVQPQAFGPVQRRPQGIDFPVLPATFMVDSNFQVMKLFHRWAQAIVNYDTSGGQFAGVNNQLPFELGYKEDFAATMQIAVYSHGSREVEYVYEFSGVYPINVGNVEASWQNGGEVMTLPVGFTYDEMKLTGARTGRVQSDRPGSTTGKLLKWFSSINNAVNTLESIKRPNDVQDAINQINNINNIVESF